MGFQRHHRSLSTKQGEDTNPHMNYLYPGHFKALASRAARP